MVSDYRVTVEISFTVPAVAGNTHEAAKIARMVIFGAMHGARDLEITALHKIAVKEYHPSPQPSPTSLVMVKGYKGKK